MDSEENQLEMIVPLIGYRVISLYEMKKPS
jgi:hypothetical protein